MAVAVVEYCFCLQIPMFFLMTDFEEIFLSKIS